VRNKGEILIIIELKGTVETISTIVTSEAPEKRETSLSI